jgi:hypothetical protein
MEAAKNQTTNPILEGPTCWSCCPCRRH